ncbi:uncharacterized protein LOC134033914 [Osmerus eperlanus]|uniref:uncharacterized protein LOC134033914 n=1 Tax=Osmerus eperlanus TaxID=29151 RepID=UPI002E10F998
MWRYRLPDYEQRLLGELQRQQHRGLFCDTMLQTDGVTVPAHGCILAALRPRRSQPLSASPFPQVVHLPTVRAQTLLKLVSLLYSGHLEGEGERELDEVMAAAGHLGLGRLVEGLKERGTEGQEWQRQFREAAMQTEVGERGVREVEVQTMERVTDGNALVEERSGVDTGTQTVNSDTLTLAELPTPFHKTPSSNSFCDDGPPVLSPQNIFLPQHLVPCPSIPADQSTVAFRSPTPSGNPGLYFEPGAYSTFDVSKPTSSSKLPVNPNDDAAPPVAQGDGAHPAKEHITNELYPRRKMEKKGVTETLDPSLTITGGIEENEMSESEREGVVYDNEVAEEERRKSRRGRKSLSRVLQMEATETRISIKVKLRRKTRGQVWQVVSLQEKIWSPQRQHPAHVPTPAPPYQAHDPNDDPADPQLTMAPVEESDEQIEKLLEDIMMGLNILPPIVMERDYERQSPHQDREPACEHLNNNTGPHRMQGSVGAMPSVCSHGNGTGGDETSTEMAFHSIPSSSFVPTRTNPAPPDPHPHVQPQPLTVFCHCAHHPSTPHQHPNTNPHQPHCNQNQAKCRNMSVQPAPTRPSCHQCPASQGHASWRDTGEGDAGRWQGGPLQKVLSQSAREHVFNLSMECPSANVEETTPRQTSTNQDWAQHNPARAGLHPPIAVHSKTACGHDEHHHLACQGATPRNELCFPEFIIPTSQGSENHSCQTIAMPTWEDLRLPRCVSPIDSEPPSSPVINHQSPFHHPTPPHVHRAPQPSLRWPPWLSQFPRELQYPLVCMVHHSEICPTTLQDPEYPCRSKNCLSRLSCLSRSNHTSTGNWFRSTTPGSKRKERNVREKKIRNAKTSKGVQLKPEKLKDETGKSTRNGVHDGPNPKREPQELTEPICKRMRLEESDATFLSGEGGKNLNKTKSHINMSVCSISLSSNDIVKGNNMDTRPTKTCPGYASDTMMNSRSSERLRTLVKDMVKTPRKNIK